MTPELIEYENDSATDVDLHRSESSPALEAARHWKWSIKMSPPLAARSTSPSRDIDSVVGTRDAHLWGRLRNAMTGHHGAEALVVLVASRWLEAKDDPFPATPARRSAAENIELSERRRRYARLLKRLDEWSADTSGFDEHVAPLIEEALRETAPRHFPDE